MESVPRAGRRRLGSWSIPPSAAGEKQLASPWVLRSGLNVFGGAAEKKYDFDFLGTVVSNRAAADGTVWGVTAYAGATTRIGKVTFEPFLYGGYRELNLDDDSAEYSPGGANLSFKLEEVRREATVGAGLSILF